MVHYIHEGVKGYNLNKNVLLSLKIDLFLSNAAFHLGLHCLPKYLFREFSIKLKIAHFIYEGESPPPQKKKCISFSEDFFFLTNSADPVEMPSMRHFIWVFNVCQSTCLVNFPES